MKRTPGPWDRPNWLVRIWRAYWAAVTDKTPIHPYDSAW